MSHPWLSVIMPTYNGAAYLAAALNSVRSQGDNNIEIIAVDDGSTDATIPILQAFANELPLQIFRRAHIGNWVANTNYGLSMARGEYVCFLHQDDLWLKNRLAVCRDLLARRPLDLLLHPSWFIDSNGERLGLWRCPLPTGNGVLAPDLVVERLLVQNFISIPAPLFKRAEAARVGALNEELWFTADWDLWLKLAACSRSHYVPRPLTAFRIHPHSQTMLRSSRIDDFRSQLERVLGKHLRAWEGLHRERGVSPVARFSVEVNTMLAACLHGHKPNWRELALQFLSLGPAGWHRFLRDSRIRERVAARIRMGQARAGTGRLPSAASAPEG